MYSAYNVTNFSPGLIVLSKSYIYTDTILIFPWAEWRDPAMKAFLSFYDRWIAEGETNKGNETFSKVPGMANVFE